MPGVNSISNVTSSVLAHYIGRAEGVMNARLATRYTVPLSNNIPVLDFIATDLAIYEVVAKRVITTTKDTENDWPSRFKEANLLLDKIVSGEIRLTTSSGDLVGLASSVG